MRFTGRVPRSRVLFSVRRGPRATFFIFEYLFLTPETEILIYTKGERNSSLEIELIKAGVIVSKRMGQKKQKKNKREKEIERRPFCFRDGPRIGSPEKVRNSKVFKSSAASTPRRERKREENFFPLPSSRAFFFLVRSTPLPVAGVVGREMHHRRNR